jgi:glycosyltransferase involved in cell wall biosynthesis
VRLILRRARVVICVSEALTQAVRDAGVERAVFVPNGIAVPAAVGEEAAPAEVLFAGRLTEEKGVRDLVEACREMNLVVCGDGPLRDLVPGTLGFVTHDELERRLAAAAVVVCPSHTEGFGVVCGEAMAHGRPVVAYATGGLANLVENGRTGLLVEPGDVAGLRGAVQLLLGDPELRRRLGAEARRRIEEHYGWNAVIAKTLDVYREVVPAPGDDGAGRPSGRPAPAAVGG